MITVENVILIGSPQAKVKGLNKSMKLALQAGVRLWHKEFLPRHFQMSAESRYDYKRRSAKYKTRKLRRFGKALPLIWTGELFRSSRHLTGLRATGRTDKIRATGTFVVPPYIRTRRRFANAPNMAEEILTLHPTEETRLRDFVEKRFIVEMKKIRTRRKVKV